MKDTLMTEDEKKTKRITKSLHARKRRLTPREKLEKQWTYFQTWLKNPPKFVVVSLVITSAILLSIAIGIERYNDNEVRRTNFQQAVKTFKASGREFQSIGSFHGTSEIVRNIADSVITISDQINRSDLKRLTGGSTKQFIDLASNIQSDFYFLPMEYREINENIDSLNDQKENIWRQIANWRPDGTSKRFMIRRRFDSDSQGRAYYEAFDMDNMQKSIVVAEEGQLSAGGYGSVTLSVESLGEQPASVDHHNAYRSYSTTEFYPTYQIVNNQGKLDELRQQEQEIRDRISKRQVELGQLSPKLEKLKEKLRLAMALLPDE